MNNKKLRISVIIISLLLVGTNIVSIANAGVPTTSYSDVLFVQVGDDSIIEETTQIIMNNLNDRNERLLQELEKQEKEEYVEKLYGMIGTTSEINFGQLNIIGSRILDINVIQISVESLENGILESYKTQVLILIGHGSEEGLKVENDKILWDDVEKIITDNSAKYSIITSCFSERATKDLPNAIGFPNIIDGIVAANIVSAILFNMLEETTLMKNCLNNALKRYMYININPKSAQILYPIIDPPPDPPPDSPLPPPVPYFSDVELGFYIAEFVILILATLINVYIPASLPWAQKLFIQLMAFGAMEYIFLFAYYAAGYISEGAMLAALVEFFSLILSQIIAVYWSVDIWQQILMIITFGVGFLLTLLELIYSAGSIVALKYGLMAVAFVALGIACYFDIMDSDGIVG